MTARARTFASSTLAWPLVALATILLYNLIFTPGFFTVVVKDGHLYGSLVDVVKNAVPVMIIAIGMTLVIATGGIDISVGAVVAISGAVAGILIVQHQAPLAAVILLPLAAAIACGAVNAFLITVLGIQPIIATLIPMVTGRGLGQLLIGGRVLWFRDPAFEYLGSGYLLGLPVRIFVAAALLAAVAAALRATPLGLYVQAVGGSARASRYAGVSVRVVKFIVYTFSGLCAGIAGLVLTANIRGSDAAQVGMYIELDAILAVVIGGTSMNGGKFNLLGSVVGALIIQSLTTTIFTKGVPVQFTLVVKATVVALVILMQSAEFRARIGALFPRSRAR
jgi:ribose/xylose/arabinose/galactoside ABC-type transport system permease subunit